MCLVQTTGELLWSPEEDKRNIWDMFEASGESDERQATYDIARHGAALASMTGRCRR